MITNTALRPSTSTQMGHLTIFDAVKISKPTINWFNTSVTSSHSTTYLRECLINGTELGISNGSYVPIQEVGACGWIISTPDGTEWIEGRGAIPGLKSGQNSYRSKLGGQLDIAPLVSTLNYLRAITS